MTSRRTGTSSGGPRPRYAGLVSTGLLVGLGLAFVLSLFVGSVTIPPGDVVRALFGDGDPQLVTVVRELRLPRALLGVFVGAALALSGASLQALLGNPLADPYLLGVSGGAACGTLAAAILGFPDAGSSASALALPLAAFLGALGAVLLVGVGASVDGRLDRGRLLLSGVIVNAFASAVILFLLSLGDPARTRGFVFWMLGSLSGASWGGVTGLVVYVAAGLALLLPLSRAFDALTLGEDTATSLGIPVQRVMRLAYLAASLLAAAAVSQAGIIGFVGLLVPHTVRRLTRGHAALLLLSSVGGALLLTVADVVSRSVFAPAEVSVGAVTAALGAPAFLVLLRRRA